MAAAVIGTRLAGRTVTVPSVLNTSPAAAQTAVRNAHLTPELSVSAVYSETIAKGMVAEVDPGPGHHAKRGSTVTLKVSLGPERYTVPTVPSSRSPMPSPRSA